MASHATALLSTSLRIMPAAHSVRLVSKLTDTRGLFVTSSRHAHLVSMSLIAVFMPTAINCVLWFEGGGNRSLMTAKASAT